VFWRGKPIYIMNRTKKQIDEARSVPVSSLPDPQTDQARVKEGHDQWLVVIGSAPISAASRSPMKAITTASSAPAMARNTTPQAAFGRDRHRPTWRCRPTDSFPIAKSRLAELRIDIREFKPAASFTSSGSHHERTIRLPADQSRDEVD
jgi:hypothetical protein